MNHTQESGTVSIIASLMLVLTVAYIVLYEPFHFVRMVPSVVRILVEFFLLFILLLLWMLKFKPMLVPVSFLIFPLLVLWLFLAGETRTSNAAGEGWFPGFITKIIFLILGMNVLGHYPALVRVLARAWVFVWIFTGIQVILSSIGYHLGIIPFTLEGDWQNGIMEYYYNPLFGQLDFRRWHDMDIPQFAGFLMEPLFLGLFAGLNILAAPYLAPKRYRKIFRYLSYVTGLLSLSVAFYLFFFSYTIYNVIKKHSSHGKLISFVVLVFVGGVVSWMVLVNMGVGEASSLGNRAMRIAIALKALTHSTTHGLLFGTYHYSQTVGEKWSASCGILSFLLQRGLIIFIPVMILFYKYSKRDHLIAAYLFYYSLLLEYFWWPAFIIFLIVFNCNKLENPATAPSADGAVAPELLNAVYGATPSSRTSLSMQPLK